MPTRNIASELGHALETRARLVAQYTENEAELAPLIAAARRGFDSLAPGSLVPFGYSYEGKFLAWFPGDDEPRVIVRADANALMIEESDDDEAEAPAELEAAAVAAGPDLEF